MRTIEPAVTGEQRKVVSGGYPRAENRATNDACESARDDGAADVKFWLLGFGMEPSPDSESESDRSAKTKDVSDEMREAVACICEHRGCRVMKYKADGAIWKNDPREE